MFRKESYILRDSQENQKTHNIFSIIIEGQEEKNLEEKEKYRQKLKKEMEKGSINKEAKDFLFSEFKIEKSNENLSIDELVDFLIPNKFTKKKSAPTPIETSKIKEEPPLNVIEINDILIPANKNLMPRKEQKNNYNQEKIKTKSGNKIEMLTKLLEKNNKPYLRIKGEVEKEMMRKEGYEMFVIPFFKKMILVCNEERNATFIIHKIENPESFDPINPKTYYENNKEALKFYYSMTKDELKALKGIELVSLIIWSNKEKWENDILNILTKQIDQKIDQKEILEIIKKEEKLEKISERVKEYLRSLNDGELMKSGSQLYKEAEFHGEKIDLKSAGYSFGAFQSLLTEIRIEKGIKLFCDQVKEYLESLPNKELKKSNLLLHQKVIEKFKVTSERYPLKTFESILSNVRVEKEIKLYWEDVKKELISLSAKELSQKSSYFYKKIQEKLGFTENDYSFSAFRYILGKVRNKNNKNTKLI
ncbi:hypothetical protein CVV26_00655 [Candidatus Kuenenbacteria bacterium HGW-Kuenenbacteria-1]|uniref:Uncharacterized protein n=1 Tax=Candidatus Kuenenbacteria bacterium HGW-Kuenenbacteria-1 TaxID=2013812 RepID=A0A2N1UPC2_9BACT|nr:MAG: hypothetical protein CVV26_00655 [Candidatus Kuenenbacteria bacterium HGW-Kuenenbacteria-1]